MAASTRGLGAKVYEALGISGHSTAFLAAIEAAIASPADDDALDALAAAMQSAKAEAVAELIYPVSPILAFHKHQNSDPAWKLGTYISRRQLIDRLWTRATDEQQRNPSPAGELARAAVLLAAQDAFQVAHGTLAYLLEDPLFDDLTKWPAQALAAVRKVVAAEQATTILFIEQVASAAKSLQFLIDDSAANLDRQALADLLTSLDRMVSFASGRPDIQWRVANFAWRIANLARSKPDAGALQQLDAARARWTAAVANAHFDRWLSEAISTQSPPPKTVGIKILSVEEFENRVSHTR